MSYSFIILLTFILFFIFQKSKNEISSELGSLISSLLKLNIRQLINKKSKRKKSGTSFLMTTSNGSDMLREDNPDDLLLNNTTTIMTTNTTNQSQSTLAAATSSVYNYANNNNNNNSSNINLNSNLNGIAGPSLVVSSTPIKPNLAATERSILPGTILFTQFYI